MQPYLCQWWLIDNVLKAIRIYWVGAAGWSHDILELEHDSHILSSREQWYILTSRWWQFISWIVNEKDTHGAISRTPCRVQLSEKRQKTIRFIHLKWNYSIHIEYMIYLWGKKKIQFTSKSLKRSLTQQQAFILRMQCSGAPKQPRQQRECTSALLHVCEVELGAGRVQGMSQWQRQRLMKALHRAVESADTWHSS